MTDKAKLYAVKNDDDKYLFGHHQWGKPGQIVLTYSNITGAKSDAKTYGGTVVELIEKPEPVKVSEEEAAILTRAKEENSYALSILHHYAGEHGGYLLGNKSFEDRLMRAYVIGWTVDKPKRWNVKVPLVQAQGGLWFLINASGKLDADYIQDLAKKFSMEEINTWGLQDCEREEVTDDEQ
ncbi:DUF1642 domain-containing protein [Lacticaseibacillus baoqingensis]|uniref:DUF1642 domain-containing protein n=1 Tax=Lacticaseibacillus baoqingensis TaxID=2486013 RepID=A0ABW4E644_9LACO|nr:DUF1642 domain-containing protein [Lacticaseibacillus baoqingensis]